MIADTLYFDSALDFTLLDPHWGTLDEWAKAIDKIHGRGMCTFNGSTISLRTGKRKLTLFFTVSSPRRPCSRLRKMACP
jgi:alpha-1,3-glucan synthase